MTSQIVVSSEIDIDASPQAVWSRLFDWDHMSDWGKDVLSSRVISDKTKGVGVTLEVLTRIGGLKGTDVLRITRWDPPIRMEVEHIGRVKGDGSMQLEPGDGRTHLVWEERLAPPLGPLGALGPSATSTFDQAHARTRSICS